VAKMMSVKTSHIFQLVGIFQRSVTHSRFAHAANKAGYKQGWTLVCACERFQHSSLHCLGSYTSIYKLFSKAMAFLEFFFEQFTFVSKL
jgi:hypothetical protein